MDCTLHPSKGGFDSLWKCNPIDENTIRITTPYASINNLYVDLFIKKQGKVYRNRWWPLQRSLTSGELEF